MVPFHGANFDRSINRRVNCSVLPDQVLPYVGQPASLPAESLAGLHRADRSGSSTEQLTLLLGYVKAFSPIGLLCSIHLVRGPIWSCAVPVLLRKDFLPILVGSSDSPKERIFTHFSWKLLSYVYPLVLFINYKI